MHVAVHILTWNDHRYLPDFLRSLQQQTYKDLSLRILDNGSTDGTREYIQKYHPQLLVARNVRNLGRAIGYNQLIRFSFERWAGEERERKAILFLQADMVLHERMIEELVTALQADDSLGAVQPKLLRAFGDNAFDEECAARVQSDVLDSTGLVLKKYWRLEDRGAGEIDAAQYDNDRDIVGATSVGTLWRASALLDVAVEGEIFDGDFFTYGEDSDVALRMRRAGWRMAYVPSARAYRYRSLPQGERKTWRQRIRHRRMQRPFFVALSTRNQLLFLLKNLSILDALRYGVHIALHELPRLLYACLFESETRRMLWASSRLLPKMLKKRKKTFALAKESAAVIRAYVRS